MSARPSTPPEDGEPEGPLGELVRRHQERQERLRDGPGVGATLATIGSLGWLVVVPLLLGIWCGRQLDRRWGTGITWTGAGVALGAALGVYLLWQALERHRPRGQRGGP